MPAPGRPCRPPLAPALPDAGAAGLDSAAAAAAGLARLADDAARGRPDLPDLATAARGAGHGALVAALAEAFRRGVTDGDGCIALTVAEGVAAAVAGRDAALGAALLAAWGEVAAAAAAAGPSSPSVPPPARAVAAATFQALVSAHPPTPTTRLAPRLASGFGLDAADLGGPDAATAALLALARAAPPAGAGPAAQLLASLPGLEEARRGGGEGGTGGALSSSSSTFDASAVSALLAGGGGEAAALSYAAARGPATPAPAALIDACLAAGRLRTAAACVRRFKLREAYPRVEADAGAAALAGAVAAGAWDAAVSMAGRPPRGGPSAAEALRGVAAAAQAAGRPCLAADVRDLAAAREEEAAASPPPPPPPPPPSVTWPGAAVPPVDAGFLAWPAGVSLSLVTDVAGVAAASQAIGGGGGGGVGFDLEWETAAEEEEEEGGGGDESPPSRPPLVSTLQLATPVAAFVFDVAACGAAGAAPALAALVAALLASPDHAILGVGLSADLARLAAALPDAVPPGGATRCVDAGRLVSGGGGGGGGGGGSGGGGAALGLAALASAALGAPLDKALRASAWAARPLTAGQVRYAGLDALVPALVWEQQQVKAGGGRAVEWEWRQR